MEARVVVELDGTEGQYMVESILCLNFIASAALDMLNGVGNIHGGCSAFLVDV